MSYTKKLTKKEHVSKFSYSRNPAKEISDSIRRLNMKITKTIALLLALSVLLVLPCSSRDRDLRKEREQLIATIDKTTTEAEDKPDNSVEVDEKASTAEVLPSAKSSDVELYVAAENGKEYVVNAYGQRADGYSIDSDKNIRDKNQVIVVAAKNTARFQYLSDLSFGSQRYDSTLPNHGLNEQGSGSSDEGTNYSTLTVLLSGAPASATNHVVVLVSSNSEIVEIRPNSNAKYLAEPTVHSGGFTEHTCTVCSYTFVDTETPPIIPEKDDELDAAFVRTEVHNFCKDCGLDFHGWSQTQVWEHCAAHVEQDDNAKGGYYSSVVR